MGLIEKSGDHPNEGLSSCRLQRVQADNAAGDHGIRAVDDFRPIRMQDEGYPAVDSRATR
jgi:hypothetical protein